MADNLTCSRALRVLGQILESRGVDLFEIRSQGEKFTLQYGDPNPPHMAIIDLSYSAADLRSLDLQARTKRQESFRFVDFNGVAEMLRALGRRVESQEGRLLRISNCGAPSSEDAILLEYQTADGRKWVEELNPAALSDDAVRMHKDRSRIRRERSDR
jgi:hypothetical protein